MSDLINSWDSRPLGQIIWARIKAFWSQTGDPDPWPPELDRAIYDNDATPVCHRCFSPQAHDGWFCGECGTAVGPYNNCMPFVDVYSRGEVLRSGVGPEARFTPLRVAGYILIGVCEYVIFCPLYFIRLRRNFIRLRRAMPNLPPKLPDEDA